MNLCINKSVPGTPGWIGTFAEYFLAPEKTVYRLDYSVSYDKGALIEPLAVAVQALRGYDGAGRDSMVILGCGTIGLLTLRWQRSMDLKIFTVQIRLLLTGTGIKDGCGCSL